VIQLRPIKEYKQQTSHERQPCQCDGQSVRVSETRHIRANQASQISSRERGPQLSGAGSNDRSRVHAGNVFRHGVKQAVRKDGLTDGDQGGAGHALEEDHHSRDAGHVGLRHHGLPHDDRDLDAQAEADARQRLVADPRAARRALLQRVDEAGAHRVEHAAQHQQRDEVAGDGDGGARHDAEERDAEDEGDVVDAGLGCRHAGHDLEVDGQVVQQQQEGAGVEGLEHGQEAERAAADESRYDQRPVAHPDLVGYEQRQQQHEAYDHADHVRAVPALRRAAPLQREDEAHERRHENKGTERVHLQDLLPQRGLLRPGHLGSLEEDDDEGSGSAADGQVDVEAPAPRQVVGEDAAEQRADDGRNGVHGAQHSRQHGRLLGGCAEGQDRVRARRDARAAHARDCAAYDQRR